MSDLPDPFNINPEDQELVRNSTPFINKAKIDFDKAVPIPPVFLEIDSIPIATDGNFSLVIGPPKSRKTFFINMVLAASVAKDGYYSPIKSRLPQNKKRVLLFDTEQSRHKVHQTADRVIKMSGNENTDNFEVYSLRRHSFIERLNIIQMVIHHRRDDVGLVVIDGIRDLVSQINDELQATKLSSMLLRLSAVYGIHIMVVLHENKKDKNARGHLGTEVTNKAETIISVKKQDKRSSTVKPYLCREIEFQPFQFYIDDKGQPQKDDSFLPYSNPKTKKKNTKPSPNEITPDQENKIKSELKKLKGKKFKRNELITRLQSVVAKHVEKMGQNKIREYLDYYRKIDLIQKVGSDRSPKAYYKIN